MLRTIAGILTLLPLLVFPAPGHTSAPGDFFIRANGWTGGPRLPLSYDDDIASWLTWVGLYRGTWFDVTDFYPSGTGLVASYTEYWFYHHAGYPWDTSSFYAELWNGDAAGPTACLDQTSMIATHFSPVHANYSPSIETEADFWGLVNTSMSSGGWPATLCDNGGNFTGTPHSFWSWDFIIWEPWMPDVIEASTLMALEADSWGGIKGLFR